MNKLSILILCALIFIQGCAVTSKPRMAIYVRGEGEPNEIIKALNSEMLEIFVNSGKYEMVERSEEFLDEIAKEQKTQRSGAIDDQQITRLGKQFGVQYVCVANVNALLGSKKITARLIDVETAAVKASSGTDSNLDTLPELKRVANEIVNPILKKYTSNKKANNAETTEKKVENKTESKLETKTENRAELKEASNSSSINDFRDGQTYRTVKIGNLVWMAENLNYNINRSDLTSMCYDNSESYCKKYGRLYDWNTAMKACPSGWRLPTKKEWDDLVKVAGGESNASKHLKADSGWKYSGGGTNTYGFSALPGGLGDDNGDFSNENEDGFWWSSTSGNNGDNIYYYRISYYRDISWESIKDDFLLSVRCVQG